MPAVATPPPIQTSIYPTSRYWAPMPGREPGIQSEQPAPSPPVFTFSFTHNR